MANKFTRFLKQALTGATNPKGMVGNWQHATRLFIDDTYRLMPRSKFLYYVRFELDKTALKSLTFSNKHADEVGYLVKTADFPKYSIESEIKNQYNRKKIVYKSINYDPVNITFHDDSQGIINAMWALYYGYYFADRNLPDAAYSSTLYRNSEDPRNAFRYGLDNNKTVDFFKSISLYTMSKRRFNGYTLVNPRIKSWQHDSGDYDTSEFMTHQMSLEYEAVKYSSGLVSFGNPKGFATLHYDTTPSPLTVAGGGVANLLGDGGVLDGLEQIFGNVSDGTAFGSIGGFLNTAILARNTIENGKRLTGKSILQEGVKILSSPEATRGVVSTVTGIVGAVLPRSGNSRSNTETVGSAKSLVNTNPAIAPTFGDD